MGSVAVVLLVHTAPATLFLSRHFFVVFNHSKLEGLMWEPRVLSSQPHSVCFACSNVYNGNCSENLPSVHKYLRFSRVSHLPALIKSITGHKS